jgi:hypothetical protein
LTTGDVICAKKKMYLSEASRNARDSVTYTSRGSTATPPSPLDLTSRKIKSGNPA